MNLGLELEHFKTMCSFVNLDLLIGKLGITKGTNSKHCWSVVQTHSRHFNEKKTQNNYMMKTGR